MTTADPTPLPRPARPIAVELAAALLIVGGLTSGIGRAVSLAGAGAPRPGEELAYAVAGTVDLLLVVVGLLVRSGRGWVLGINVAALACFLYLTAAPNGVALFSAALFAIVLGVLLANRSWFDGIRRWRRERTDPRR